MPQSDIYDPNIPTLDHVSMVLSWSQYLNSIISIKIREALKDTVEHHPKKGQNARAALDSKQSRVASWRQSRSQAWADWLARLHFLIGP
jgi:hypothetical protein